MVMAANPVVVVEARCLAAPLGFGLTDQGMLFEQ